MKLPHGLQDRLTRHHILALLVICFFISGLIDVVSLATWGLFANLQTGNTILVTIQLTNGPGPTQHPQHWVKSLVAVLSYCAGALVFGWMQQIFRFKEQDKSEPLYRIELLMSFGAQVSALLVAAALAYAETVSTREHNHCLGYFSSGNNKKPLL